jgi:DNA-binding NarL/FixJ family response regulator
MNELVRILITDDQQPTRQGLKALLSFTAQVEIVGEASNGQEAVQMAGRHQPDVVLMDMHMPVMDGLEATRIIKSRWPGIGIIALTIHPTYRLAAFEAGADAFLLKGCAAELLEKTIIEAANVEQFHTH